MLASVPFAVPKATVDYDERLSTIVNNRPRGMPVFCAAPAPTTPASRADRSARAGLDEKEEQDAEVGRGTVAAGSGGLGGHVSGGSYSSAMSAGACLSQRQ